MEQHFRVFKEVAETNNITLSAKNLHMSQPSISLQIQNLENEFGARFFDRTNKGVTLTEEGEIFYARVRTILDILTDVREELNAMAKNRKRKIYLGATLTIGEYFLPNILAYLYQNYPEVDFKVKIANSNVIIQDVADKKMHIGLIEDSVAYNKDLKAEKFWDDELVVVIPNFHPWASRDSVTLAELPSERLVTREEGSGTRKVMELALKDRGFNPNQLNITMVLESIQAIKQVVSAGLGYTIISSLTVNQENDRTIFKTLKIEDTPILRPFNILTNPQNTQSKDEHNLVELLLNHELLVDILNTNFNEVEEDLSTHNYTHAQLNTQEDRGNDQEQWKGH